MNCITIDDELNALNLINSYIKKIDFLNLKGSFQNAIKAAHFCENNDVDLIFLDINMPDISGLQFLKSLHKDPLVIFITAYSEFALESFNFNVVDYLLKPIEFERFLKAANKAYKSFIPKEVKKEEDLPSESSNEFIHLKSNKTVYKLNLNDILFIQSLGNYVQVHSADKVITAYFSLNQILDSLPSDNFIRIHKMYIVNLEKIEQYEKHRVKVGKLFLPIGQTYRKLFEERVK
ncbi:MAG TPA: LytTR family DNA-binding domain-containing protein [Tenuifilaceae bacterium]|nr:LytTR family DNA-binding domain-containing protein [Tenuifilaceae bacterium]HPJ45552.1 LytTR family DNA-binding domain-containing protein [Tenuifilaceae bacterium]HPQ35777.1 LytTR family DNA-binding domain-containing protein [Tenuifilaceae bacterium]HRX68456.1 LytTR family DNA-binding domain-containing protein [Tenuifilaceae bacterium]